MESNKENQNNSQPRKRKSHQTIALFFLSHFPTQQWFCNGYLLTSLQEVIHFIRRMKEKNKASKPVECERNSNVISTRLHLWKGNSLVLALYSQHMMNEKVLLATVLSFLRIINLPRFLKISFAFLHWLNEKFSGVIGDGIFF